MTYSETQFKLGQAKARYNNNTNNWHPAVGGAVNFLSSFSTLEDATSKAAFDKKANNFKLYE